MFAVFTMKRKFKQWWVLLPLISRNEQLQTYLPPQIIENKKPIAYVWSKSRSRLFTWVGIYPTNGIESPYLWLDLQRQYRHKQTIKNNISLTKFTSALKLGCDCKIWFYITMHVACVEYQE